ELAAGEGLDQHGLVRQAEQRSRLDGPAEVAEEVVEVADPGAEHERPPANGVVAEHATLRVRGDDQAEALAATDGAADEELPVALAEISVAGEQGRPGAVGGVAAGEVARATLRDELHA